MRKLVYNCYYKDTKIATVNTLNEAKEWMKKNKDNSIKESFIEVTKKETKEEKEIRLARIAKRIQALKAKG